MRIQSPLVRPQVFKLLGDPLTTFSKLYQLAPRESIRRFLVAEVNLVWGERVRAADDVWKIAIANSQ